MKKRYLIEYGDTRDLLTQKEFENFLTIAVMHNKDITTFKVTDLDRISH